MSAVLPEIDAILKAWTEHVLMENRRGAPEPHPYLYASSRRACRRRMYLECTEPTSFPDFDADTKARFSRGNARERDISIDLMRVGRLCIPKFEFVSQQERVGIVDRKGRKVISGKIDGAIRWESGAAWPAEIKSWSTFLTDRIFSFGDLLKNRYTWGGAHQLLSYLYEKNAPYGVLILDRPGLPRLIQVSLEENIQAMEDFLKDGEVVVDAIEAQQPPPFHDDPEECKKCPIFGSACNPELKYDGAMIITDDEWLAKIERHEALRSDSKEYADLHDEINEHVKTMVEKGKATTIIAGKYAINVKWGKNTVLDMPADLKKQYQKTDDAGKISVKIVGTE